MTETKNNLANSNRNIIISILLCIAFIISVFSYTIIYRIDHVTAIDRTKYHQAVDEYLNTESYH